MDTINALLLILTFLAFCWWFKLRLDEDKYQMKKIELEKQEQHARKKRLQQLTNRSQ